MRFLIIILFPFLSHAQMGGMLMAQCGQYNSETAIKFGVLVNSATLSNPEKADIAKDTLGCNWNRGAITIETWSGSSTRYETYDAKGMLQLVVINYHAASGQPFPTSGQLAGYADTLALILDTYPNIYGIVIENEQTNTTFHTGPLSDYIAEIQTAYPIAHSRGIKVIDGGFYGSVLDINVYRWLVTKYGQSVADEYGAGTMTNAQINAAQTINSNPTLEAKAKQLDTIFQATNYVDFFNIHPYEDFSQSNTQPDTVTQITPNIVRYQKEYVEETTHRPCITNETGQRDNDSPTLVTNMLAEYYRLGFWHVQWFNGVGGLAGAVPLTDETTGINQPNGIAFRDYILSHQGNIYFPLP